MTLLLCVVLYPDIPRLCYYVLFYIMACLEFVTMCCFRSIVFWHCYFVLFYIRVYHDFVTMYCFTFGCSCLCYYVLFYIPIFHSFVIMCCFISRYSIPLLLCVVLYPDIPWLCYYVLFYIQCVVTKIRSFGDTIHLISQLSCWL